MSSPGNKLIDLAGDTSASAHPSTSTIAPGTDPSISLKALGAQPGAGLQQLDTFADIQGKLNQNRLFQQSWSAKVKAGKLLAAAPDLETGMAAMYQDPDVAPFAGDIVNSIRQGMLAQTQNQGEISKQAQTGFDIARKGLTALAADPSQATWDAATKPALATLGPQARKQAQDALETLHDTIFSGLPDDPQQAAKTAQARIAGLMSSSPDVWGLMFGKPSVQDVGNKLLPGMTSQTSGEFMPHGQSLGKGLAPQVVHGQGPEGQDVTTVVGGDRNGNALGGSDDRVRSGGNAGATGGGSPAGLLVGPDQTTSGYNTKRAADIVDYEKSLDDRVYNGSTLRKNIDATVTAARSAQMGGGAEAYTKLGQSLQAIGVNNPTVDKWANGSLAASQVIDKVALQNSMSQLKQQLTGVGGSRLNAQEFVAYLNKNPNLTTDPRAASEIFQLWNQFYDRDKAEQQAFDKFKSGKPTGDRALDDQLGNSLSGGHDIKRWPALWNSSEYMSKFAPGGAVDTSGMKGTPGAVPDDIKEIMRKHGGK